MTRSSVRSYQEKTVEKDKSMTMGTEALKNELGLDDNYDLVLNSQIGYPKK